MREPKSFIVTLLLDDHDAGPLRGRVRSVASGVETTFSGVDQLADWLRAQVTGNTGRPPAPGPLSAALDSEGDNNL